MATLKDIDVLIIGTPDRRWVRQAIAASRLGTRTSALARFPQNESHAKEILSNLENEGVLLNYVLVGEGELTPSQVNASLDAFNRSSVLLVNSDLRPDTLLAAMRLAIQDGLRIVIELRERSNVPDSIFTHCDVARLSNGHANSLRAAFVAAQPMLAHGSSAVLVRAGHRGNLMVLKNQELWIPWMVARQTDATEDALLAALAVALADGRDYFHAALFASGAAALGTAEPPLRDDVLELLNRNNRAPNESTEDTAA